MNTFIEFYEDKWTEKVSGAALEAMESAKYITVKLLPFVKDVEVLLKHIGNEINKAKTSQASDFTKMCKRVLA